MTTYISDIAHYNEVLAPQELVYQFNSLGHEIAQANMFPEMAYYEFKVYKK